jgi:hypothetical protein
MRHGHETFALYLKQKESLSANNVLVFSLQQ